MKKLAIVGSHSATRADAPFGDPDFEIWVFNEAPQLSFCKRWDVVFQLHKPEVYTSPNNFVRKDHWDWLQKKHTGKTIYMQDCDPRVPASRRYPMDEICAGVPGAAFGWFTSSPSYALALALFLGYREIEIYGVELSSNTEYSYQLNNWVYWVGVALGMGVNLTLKSGEMHFSGRKYAYQGEIQIERIYFAERATSLAEGLGRAKSALVRAKNEISKAILEQQYAKIGPLCAAVQELAMDAGEIEARSALAAEYAARPDPIPRQEFERRGAQAREEGEDLRGKMYHEGGKVEYVWNVLKMTGNYEAVKQLRMFLNNMEKHALICGQKMGAWQENMDYMTELDARITAAGGQKTIAALTGVST
jgi:hypothetical protein